MTSPEETITVVSGLPRSGTSMMMRILAAGGVPAVTDEIRTADVDNPGGYYELERVKKIKEDTSWLPDTRGRAFKMVSMLLFHLPAAYTYRIVFMCREMSEILASQRKMLERLGKPSDVDDADMAAMFTRHLEKVRAWLAQQENMDVLNVQYRDVISAPAETAARLAAFLQRDLDTAAMAAVVDLSLYRNRSAGSA